MILKTKVIPPPLRPRRVDRPRLYARLDEVLERRLALIVAPAGYGKSSLVRAWLERHMGAGDALSIAWLSLDSSDDDVARFFTALIATLRESTPGKHGDLGQSVLSTLEQPQRPPAEALVTRLLNELHETCSQFVVVLDDYHLLQDEVLHEALTLFVERLPARVHLVISSRADPALPLWRLRAADDLVELGAADLRFSAEETATFFAEVMGHDLPADTIADLDKQLEGWIAGLQLAALAGRGADEHGQYTADRTPAARQSHIFDYLAREVLERQPPAVRHFLLATSIADRFCSPLCDVLLQDDGAHAQSSRTLLRRLVSGNLFLVPLDHEGRWFRYHHLFRAFLRRQLARHGEAGHAAAIAPLPEANALHARAAAWFADNGYWDEAIHHALAGGDIDGAAVMVGRAISGLFRRGKLVAIRHYLELLPEEVILSRHNYCVGYAWVLALGGELQRVEKYVQAAETQLALMAQDAALRFDVNAQRSNLSLIRATVARRHGDAATMARLSRRALGVLEKTQAPALCSIAALTLGEAQAMNGQMREAQQMLQRAVVHGETAGHRYLACSALSSLARLRRRQGRLREAEALYRRILEQVGDDDKEGPAITGSAIAGLGALAYEWNRLPEAHELAQRAVTLHEAGGEAAALVRATMLLARVQLAQGETSAGRETLQTALALSQRWQLPAELAWIDAWRARYTLQEGNVQAALTLARQAAAELDTAASDHPDFSELREFIELTVARAQLARGRAGVDEATSILEKWQAFAETQGLSTVRIETSLLQGQAQGRLGNAAQAKRRLLQALMLAEPEGFVRLFADEGAAVTSQLREVLASSVPATYGQRLLSSFTDATAGAATMISPQEALTDRQHEILSLMARGLSNREIAEQLVISPETVRWHTKQIYRRLDVRNRTEAAAYARHSFPMAS